MDLTFSNKDFLNYNPDENYITYFRFFRILILLRVVKIFKKIEYMTFIFQIFKNAFLSLISIFFIFLLFICFSSLLGRSLYREIDIKYFPQSPNFSSFSQSFMTIFTIITLDNWFDLMKLGSGSLWELFSITTFLISVICIGKLFEKII